MDPELKKPLIVGGLLFLFTLGWAYFFNQLGVTPQSLLLGVGRTDEMGYLFTFPFAAFALLFSASLGLITAYADKDERGRIYMACIIPTLIATTISSLVFDNFAQWYPLALFFFGSIPLIIETTRLKRLELKNFVVARSSFSGVQRGMQILGIGVLVTLAITAFPQNDSLYQGFEDSFFAGKIVQQVDVEKLTTDFLISTQRGTITQIIETESFQKLRNNTTPDDQQFVSLMDQTLANVNSPEYREEVNKQIKEQQSQINPQDIVSQLQQTIPGYDALKNNYWAIAAFLSSLIYFLIALFLLQPLAALMGTGFYHIIPMDGYENETPKPKSPNGSKFWNVPSSQTPRVTTDNVTGWSSPPAEHPTDISAEPEKTPKPVVPDYTHVDEK